MEVKNLKGFSRDFFLFLVSPINPYERPQFYGDSTMNEIIDRDPRCAACSSFGSGLGMVSNDHATKTSYLSTQV